MITNLKREPDPEIIRMLEELLEMAKAGDLMEFVCVGNLTSDGAYVRHSVFKDRWRLLGAIEYAKSSIANA